MVLLRKDAYHWLYELDAVVLGRVVGSCDHDSDPFSLECSRSKSSNKTNTGQDRIENVAAVVSHVRDILYAVYG
jgi:hypothetical protein